MSNSGYRYRIHPAIGFARVGDAPASFYLAPTGVGAASLNMFSIQWLIGI